MFNQMMANLASSVGGGLLDQDEQPKPVDLKSDPSSVTNVVSQLISCFKTRNDSYSCLPADL
jgi:hypothetical protein